MIDFLAAAESNNNYYRVKITEIQRRGDTTIGPKQPVKPRARKRVLFSMRPSDLRAHGPGSHRFSIVIVSFATVVVGLRDRDSRSYFTGINNHVARAYLCIFTLAQRV